MKNLEIFEQTFEGNSLQEIKNAIRRWFEDTNVRMISVETLEESFQHFKVRTWYVYGD